MAAANDIRDGGLLLLLGVVGGLLLLVGLVSLRIRRGFLLPLLTLLLHGLLLLALLALLLHRLPLLLLLARSLGGRLLAVIVVVATADERQSGGADSGATGRA